MFNLFNWNVVDFMFFSFLQGRLWAPEKSGASQRFCAPERAWPASEVQFLQACCLSGIFIQVKNIKNFAFFTCVLFLKVVEIELVPKLCTSRHMQDSLLKIVNGFYPFTIAAKLTILDSKENTFARVSFLIKLQAFCNLIKKETLAQMLSCELCEISKNTFSAELLWTTASVVYYNLFNSWMRG